MVIGNKVFEALTTVLKMNNELTRMAEDVKLLAHEVKEIDKRLIRLETYLEVAEKQKKLLK